MAFALALAVVVPMLLLRTLVRESAHQAVESEVVRLSLGILDAARSGLDNQLELVHASVEGGRLSPDGTRFTLPFVPVPLGQPYLIRPQGPSAGVHRLVSEGTPGEFVLESSPWAFLDGGPTLEVLTEAPTQHLWVGELPFLPEAPTGLWMVGWVANQPGGALLAVPLDPGHLRQWLDQVSRAVAAEVSLVTSDNVVLPLGRPALFDQPWAARALSRSKEGDFFTFDSGETLVHVYADPVYLYNLVAVTPRGVLTASVDAVIDHTTVVTALVALVLGGVSLGLLVLFARRLRLLTDRLSALTEGQYQALSGPTRVVLTETERIDRGIALLAERLDENQKALEASRLELEQRVADRTANLSQALEVLRETQESLVQTEKMAALGRTVAAFTHEINNPLGAALTVIGLVEDGVGQLQAELGGRVDPLVQAVALVHKNLQRAIDVTGSLKHVATDQTRAEVRAYDLAAYLEEVVQSVRPHLRTGQALELQASPGIVLEGDPAVFYQIVSNLVLNSVKHGFEGRTQGKIQLSVRLDGPEVVVGYQDDGHGMDAQQLSRIYEPFYTTKRSAGGSGLGMSIVYNLVNDELRGRIACESAPGAGVRFTIRFPVRPGQGPR